MVASVIAPGLESRALGLLLCAIAVGVADGGTCEGMAGGSQVRVGHVNTYVSVCCLRSHWLRDVPVDNILRLRGGGAADDFGEPRIFQLVAATCPDKTLALTNHVYLNSEDILRMFDSATPRYLQMGGFIYAASESDAVAAANVALNSAQRKTLRVSSGEHLQATALTELPSSKMHAASLELAIDFAGRTSANEALPADVIASHVLRTLGDQVLTVGQQFVSEVRGLNLLFTVKSVLTFKDAPPQGAAADSADIRALWSNGGVTRQVLSLLALLVQKYKY